MNNILQKQLELLKPSNQFNTCNLKYKDKILWDIFFISIISYNIVAYYLYNNYNKYIGLFFIFISIFSALSDSNLVNNNIISYIDRIIASIGFIFYLFFIFYNFNTKNMYLSIIITYLAIYSINKARSCDDLDEWKFYQNLWHIIPSIYIILLIIFDIEVNKI